MIENWSFTPEDASVATELSDFLPDKVFDVHAHVYKVADLNLTQEGLFTQGPEEISAGIWRKCQEKQLGKNKLKGALFFPLPAEDSDIEKQNEYLKEQLRITGGSKGLLIITPDTTDDYILRGLNDPGIIGLKPYHQYSIERPTFESSIFGYMPERQWSIAGEHGSIVMLHLVCAGALSDEGNLETIRYVCEKYPGIKLVLAHAARGFCAQNTVKSISRLRGLENVWFDTSGVCESAAIVAIIEEFGTKRLMWGSDLPLSEMRVRCVTVGDSFIWLNNMTVRWDNTTTDCRPILVGLESLRALRYACDKLGLNAGDVSDIFYNNAIRLTGGD